MPHFRNATEAGIRPRSIVSEICNLRSEILDLRLSIQNFRSEILDLGLSIQNFRFETLDLGLSIQDFRFEIPYLRFQI